MNEASVNDLIRAAVPLHQAGQFAQAELFYDEILRRQPNNHDALHLKGLIAHQQKRHEEAVELIGRAVRLRDKEPGFWFNFGNVLRAAGRNAEAVEAYRSAIALKPDFADAFTNLGNALEDLERTEEADAARQSVAILRPKGAEAQFRMGTARNLQNDMHGAVEAFRQAIAIDKEHFASHVELATTLSLMGLNDEAIAAHRQHLAVRKVEPRFHDNLLFCMQYSDTVTPTEVFAEHRKWAQLHADPLTPASTPPRERKPGARLRVGYISPDFREHAVANFFEPILLHHDRSRFEIFCYSIVSEPDEVTARFKAAAEHWREATKTNDTALAKQIEEDGIDVLFDLTGHTSRNRLIAMARHPALVQATYLGYPATTGMKAIDYRITDALTDPPGMTENYYTEKLLRLPGCFLCFATPRRAPAIAPPPFETAGHLTFGSFNHGGKITPTTLRLWAKVLSAVPGSSLVLKGRGLMDASTQQRLRDTFAQLGISPDRIEFLRVLAIHHQHLEDYARIDIAMDTFPYNGTTTTCESLWMGVPVISLAGQTHVSRVGLSLLTNAGLGDLTTENAEAFVAIAKTLAGDRSRLAELRTTLRDRMSKSPLMDAAGFTRNFENAIQQMWQSRASRPQT